jgi:aspartate/methionine/tyrosine aminotransferase
MRNLFLALVLANLAFAAWSAWFSPDQRVGRSANEGLPALTLVSEVPEDLRSTGVVAEDATAPSSMQELAIILDGFSKTYAMTGWRLGYGVMPEELAKHVTKLMVNSNSCTATFTQRAALAALQGPQDAVDVMIAEFRRRRDVFIAGLNKIPGISCAMPQGAFYAFPNVMAVSRSSQEVADYLMQEGGVACLAGRDFGAYGEGYLRFSYANSLENLEKALARIADCMARLQG